MLVGAAMFVEGVEIDVDTVDLDGDDVLLPHATAETETTSKIPTVARRRFISQCSSVALLVGRGERPDRKHWCWLGFTLPTTSHPPVRAIPRRSGACCASWGTVKLVQQRHTLGESAARSGDPVAPAQLRLLRGVHMIPPARCPWVQQL